MKVKLKQDVSAPRWSHVVPKIPKGTIVEFNEKDRTIQHPKSSVMIVLQEKNGEPLRPENFDKKFEKV